MYILHLALKTVIRAPRYYKQTQSKNRSKGNPAKFCGYLSILSVQIPDAFDIWVANVIFWLSEIDGCSHTGCSAMPMKKYTYHHEKFRMI